MNVEKFAEEIMLFVEDKANELRGLDNGFALFNIGEYDRLSCLCDEVAIIVSNAIKRENTNL